MDHFQPVNEEVVEVQESEQHEQNYSEAPYSPNFPMQEAKKESAPPLFVIQQEPMMPPAKYSSIDQMRTEFWKERKQKMLDIPEKDMLNKTKNMSVPMARVKKIMRIDEDVKHFMISSDAPIFMAQAAEFFIEEMTAMGWQYVAESRRRILQKADIAQAVQKKDQFDFLIDFLPPKTTINDNLLTNPAHSNSGNSGNSRHSASSILNNINNGKNEISQLLNHGFQCTVNEAGEYQITSVPQAPPTSHLNGSNK